MKNVCVVVGMIGMLFLCPGTRVFADDASMRWTSALAVRQDPAEEFYKDMDMRGSHDQSQCPTLMPKDRLAEIVSRQLTAEERTRYHELALMGDRKNEELYALRGKIITFANLHMRPHKKQYWIRFKMLDAVVEKSVVHVVRPVAASVPAVTDPRIARVAAVLLAVYPKLIAANGSLWASYLAGHSSYAQLLATRPADVDERTIAAVAASAQAGVEYGLGRYSIECLERYLLTRGASENVARLFLHREQAGNENDVLRYADVLFERTHVAQRDGTVYFEPHFLRSV